MYTDKERKGEPRGTAENTLPDPGRAQWARDCMKVIGKDDVTDLRIILGQARDVNEVIARL